MLESVRNSTIYNVSSRMYYQYFTFKCLDYIKDIVFSLILLQIFFQRNIFRKLRITVISSSQWSVASTFWVIWGNVRCRLVKPLIFWGLHKNNYEFHFTFLENAPFSFFVSLTINRDISFHKRVTVHLWFIESWGINGISFPIWQNSFTLCIFRQKYFNCGGSNSGFFHF